MDALAGGLQAPLPEITIGLDQIGGRAPAEEIAFDVVYPALLDWNTVSRTRPAAPA